MFKSIDQESIISEKPYDLLSFYSEPLQIQEQFSYFEPLPKSLDELMPQEPLKKPRKKRKKQINYLQRRIRKPNGTQKQKISSYSTFSQHEDQLILKSVLSLGPKFEKIAKLFPTKTLHMVKNRYYKTLRFQWDSILGDDFKHLNSLKESSIDQNLKDNCQVKYDERKKTENYLNEDANYQSSSQFLIDSLRYEDNVCQNEDIQFM